MNGYTFCGGYWWIFPLVMIVFCIFFMRMRRGRRGMICGCCFPSDSPESAMEILDKRYARGDIDQREYEERKMKLTGAEKEESCR